MRTRKSIVTFSNSFTLNRDSGELPAGNYSIEVDEDEILAADRAAYHQTAVYIFVENLGSTRMLVVDPADFDAAMNRDSELGTDSGRGEGNEALPPDVSQ